MKVFSLTTSFGNAETITIAKLAITKRIAETTMIDNSRFYIFLTASKLTNPKNLSLANLHRNIPTAEVCVGLMCRGLASHRRLDRRLTFYIFLLIVMRLSFFKALNF